MRALYLAGYGGLGDFHDVAELQCAALLHRLRGDVVQLGALGGESYVDALDELVCAHVLGVGDGGCAFLHVLRRGVERSDAVELHALALCQLLDETVGELAEHARHDVEGEDAAVVGGCSGGLCAN